MSETVNIILSKIQSAIKCASQSLCLPHVGAGTCFSCTGRRGCLLVPSCTREVSVSGWEEGVEGTYHRPAHDGYASNELGLRERCRTAVVSVVSTEEYLWKTGNLFQNFSFFGICKICEKEVCEGEIGCEWGRLSGTKGRERNRK